MGGLVGIVSKKSCALDLFFSVDYHSHLGTRYGGMAVFDTHRGFVRSIHNIETTPFRTKFECELSELAGNYGIGCISDSDPQPLVIRSHLGTYAISTVAMINNTEKLISAYFSKPGHQFALTTNCSINNTEMIAALINQQENFVFGIKHAQETIDGTAIILILTSDGIIVARDKIGRLPIHIGKNDNGYCISFESFAYQKLGFETVYELGAGEIVSVTPEGFEVLSSPLNKMRICSFLWTYYGYPNSDYEGVNVELMRYRNGMSMADDEIKRGTLPKVDFIAGVPDSGTPHAIGFSNKCGISFARPLVKYTPTWPRSFMPMNQNIRNQIAKMKQIPVKELIYDKKLLFVDDSIVRGTQLCETVNFLYGLGAKEVHMRSACPPIMHSCKFLNFSRGNSDMDLLARRVIYELEGEDGDRYLNEYSEMTSSRGKMLLNAISKKLGFESLSYQSINGVVKSIGLDVDKLCTYCWTGQD